MNNLIHINEFFNKIYENDSETHQKLIDIFFEDWKNGIGYDTFAKKIGEEYGELAQFLLQIGMYNSQVNNGGHQQYYDNGYASYGSSGFGATYDNINLHEELLDLFVELNMKKILKHGNELYSILYDFELDLTKEEEECDECGGKGYIDCDKCNGNGNIDCEECGGTGEIDEDEACSNCSGSGLETCKECDGSGSETCYQCGGDGYTESNIETPDTSYWGDLDDEYYKIGDKIMEEIENYLNSPEAQKKMKSIMIKYDAKKYNI